jgi:anti-anti-sigma factor
MTGTVFTLQFADTSGGAPRVATVTGEIDVTNADDFAESVRELSEHRPVVLDLSSLRYLDSAGFTALDRLLVEGDAVIVIALGSLVHRAAVVMELPFQPDADSALQAAQAIR